MVFKREVEGDITSVTKAKVVVYSCPVDITQTETKGTVLIKSADELLNFSRGEESLLEKQIKDIAESGVNVVVAGAKFGDMALHFLNKYGLMAVRLNSKFDLRRLARTVNATVSNCTLTLFLVFIICIVDYQDSSCIKCENQYNLYILKDLCSIIL